MTIPKRQILSFVFTVSCLKDNIGNFNSWKHDRNLKCKCLEGRHFQFLHFKFKMMKHGYKKNFWNDDIRNSNVLSYM